MKNVRLALLSLCFFWSFLILASEKDFTTFVDPRIGNVSQLLVPTYPTFSLPNQMLRMFPIKQDYIADQITAWPLQVEAHREAGYFRMKVTNGEIEKSTWNKKMVVDHDMEVVKPWLYSTYLVEDDIRLSFTPSKKSAIYKIDFPATSQKNILLTGTDKFKVSSISGNIITLEETFVYKVRGITPSYRSMTAYCYAEITNSKGLPINNLQITPEKSRVSISSKSVQKEQILFKYAISYVSAAQAKKNFEIELKNIDFETASTKGKQAWGKVINQIKVEGGTEAQKRTFYTSLYRTYERMIDINEYGQYYSGYDNKVHQTDRPFFVDDWVWDTYLAKHPLNTILNPSMQSDQLNSFVQMYEQSGWMPTFPQVQGNHLCMNSYHTTALFIDAYRKGIAGFDLEKAYKGARKNLTEGTFLPWRQGYSKVGIDDFFHQNGYFPALQPGELETEPLVDAFEKRQAIAVSLGISFDNWCLSELAKELKKSEDSELFAKKSMMYKQLWHPDQKLFMPKDINGNWIKIDPKLDGGPGFRDYYDENNGWTYAWQVQHDIEGLITLLGGKKKAEERLDQLFREPLGKSKQEYLFNAPDATGQVGQFVMGNEPSMHIPYLYNYFGAPWKTQKRVRFLLDVWFKDNIFGIPGDEDGGGLSSFVIFSSLGFYPMVPGIPVYTITSPVFEKSTIQLNDNKSFTVLAKGASNENKYIQKAFLNGKEIFQPFFTHKELMDGGVLEIVLGPLPNKKWGINN